jgi:hypothetical protein
MHRREPNSSHTASSRKIDASLPGGFVRRLPSAGRGIGIGTGRQVSQGIPLLMTAIIATAAPGCSWAHPGANPYRGDPVSALGDFAMPEDTRRQLRVLMASHRYTDVVTITRDDITGAQAYTDLREMHSGHGQTCHGSVVRSAWDADRKERGLVYCVGDTCVIVPTICNNVSLVSRKPDEATLSPVLPVAEGPLEFEPPAAGPPKSAVVAPAPGALAAPADFDMLPGGGFAGGFPGSGGGDEIGGGPCCAEGVGVGVGVGVGGGGGGGPGLPGGPTLPTAPLSPVPEGPTWALLLAGLALVVQALRRRPLA